MRIRHRGKRGIYTAEFGHNGQHQKRSLRTADQRVARRRAVELEAELASGEYAAPDAGETPALRSQAFWTRAS